MKGKIRNEDIKEKIECKIYSCQKKITRKGVRAATMNNSSQIVKRMDAEKIKKNEGKTKEEVEERR